MNMPLMAQTLEIQDAGDDVLVHDRARGKIHVLNQAAGAVLRACDGETSMRTIAERFDSLRADEVERDIVSVIEQFKELGLIAA
jgi:hypothetical protein